MIGTSLVVLVGVTVGITAWFRLGAITPEGDPIEYWGRKGRQVYSQLDTIPAGDAGKVASLFTLAPVADAEGLLNDNPESLSRLRAAVGAFIVDRMSASTPDAYLDTMIAKGYHLKSAEQFARRYGPWSDLAKEVGVESDDPREIFAGLWDYAASRAAAINRLCTGPDAAFVTIGHASKDEFMSQAAFGSLGYDLWHGGSAGTCRLWTTPPVTREQLIATSDRIVVATVGVIVDVPGSARRPIMIDAYLDPEGAWWIDGVTVLNYIGTGSGWMCMEY